MSHYQGYKYEEDSFPSDMLKFGEANVRSHNTSSPGVSGYKFPEENDLIFKASDDRS